MGIPVHYPQYIYLCHNDTVVSVTTCQNISGLWTDQYPHCYASVIRHGRVLQ